MATFPNRLGDNTYVAGILQARTLIPSADCVKDEHVEPDAKLDAAKIVHPIHRTLSQGKAVDAVDQEECIHVVRGLVGTIKSFSALLRVAPDNTDVVTVDLLKNGVSVLSAVITLNSATPPNVPQDGTLSVTAVTEDDLLDVKIDYTVGAGSKPKGVSAYMKLFEQHLGS